MNKLSTKFSELLFSNFPQFREYLTIKSYNDFNDDFLINQKELENKFGIIEDDDYRKEGGYLELEIPHGEEVFNILTIDNEITIGFSWYHIHFNSNKIVEAVNFIKDLINENIIIVAEVNNGMNRSCRYIRKEDIGNLKRKIDDEEIDCINVKSWHGTYNQSVTI